MSNKDDKGKPGQRVTSSVFPYLLLVIFLLISIVPIFFMSASAKIALYYGTLFFVSLFGFSIWLMLHVEPTQKENKIERDYRVVHFILRLALAFGIGAVIIAVIVVASQLQLLPSF